MNLFNNAIGLILLSSSQAHAQKFNSKFLKTLYKHCKCTVHTYYINTLARSLARSSEHTHPISNLFVNVSGLRLHTLIYCTCHTKSPLLSTVKIYYRSWLVNCFCIGFSVISIVLCFFFFFFFVISTFNSTTTDSSFTTSSLPHFMLFSFVHIVHSVQLRHSHSNVAYEFYLSCKNSHTFLCCLSFLFFSSVYSIN